MVANHGGHRRLKMWQGSAAVASPSDVSSDAQASQPELYRIENFSPLPGGSTLPQIKDSCVAVKGKLSFSDVEKKQGCKVTVQFGITLRGAGFQPPNAKELLALNQVLPQLRH